MPGDRLRTLREAKCWSQAHLADAARLNIRTVQRIEAGEPASDETLLSLAAALDVDVTELDEARLGRSGERWPAARTALSLLLVGPAALFVLVNLVRSIGGIAAPYDALASAGGRLMSFHAFNLVSPFLFIGGPAAAVIICLPALFRLRTGRPSRGVLSITGLELRANWRAVAVTAAAVLIAATLVGYAAVEAMGTFISR